MSARVFVLIPAAGLGTRVNAELDANLSADVKTPKGNFLPKQYQILGKDGMSMLVKTLTPFLSHPGIHHISVLVQETDVHIATILANFPQVQIVRCGADTRAQTVQGAIECLRQQVKDDDWVLVHDAARPGLVAQDLTRLFDALIDEPVGALLALPVVDTVKRQDPDQIIPHVKETLERSELWLAQTPQAFRYQVLQRALNLAKKNDFVGITDEASAVEALGLTPRLVKGSSLNFKVTTADDLALARVLWA